MTAKEHNRLAGIFLLAHGAFQGVVMALICVIYFFLGAAMLVGGRQGEEKIVGGVFIGVIVLIAIIGSLFIGPQIIGGYKMWRERPGARTWGIVGSILSCLSIPFGTAAGVYGLWFLFGDQGQRFYMNGADRPVFPHPPQAPEPNSWQ